MASDDKISKRCGEISNSIVNEPWYAETVDSIIEAQQEICKCGAGIKPLLSKYDTGCLKIHCAIEELIYKKAYEAGAEAKCSLVSKLVSKEIK
jgi:hypothetical protein